MSILTMPRQNQRRKHQVQKNRELFLSELRSGKYQKGTILSDESGEPIVSSPEDEGSCACAIMHNLFFEYEGTKNSRNYLKALDLTPIQCRFIQQKLNDTELSFREIADAIENFVFNAKKQSLENAIADDSILPANELRGFSLRNG